jgi:hypothetical protein
MSHRCVQGIGKDMGSQVLIVIQTVKVSYKACSSRRNCPEGERSDLLSMGRNRRGYQRDVGRISIEGKRDSKRT